MVQGSGYIIEGFEVGGKALGLFVLSLGFMVQGLGSRV
jgi:hypothetical protein